MKLELKTDKKTLIFTKYTCIEVEIATAKEVLTYIMSSNELDQLKEFINKINDN